MSRMPGAIWDPLGLDWAKQPRMRAHDIVCIHTMVGSLEGTDSLFRHTNGAGYAGIESHYGTGYDGRIEQWQDNAFVAEANYLGSWHIVSIENADYGTGFPKWNTSDGSQVPAFTDAQIEANARIIAWECSKAAHAQCPPTWTCHREGIPIALIPDAKLGRRGVAYHRQGVPGFMAAGAEQWSTSRGKVCPGDRRIAQIPQIIARARQIAGGNDSGGFMSALTDAEQREVLENTRANRAVLYFGGPGQPKELTVYSRVVDIQMALTNALPQLLASAKGNDPTALTAAVVAAIPDDLAQDVIDGLAARLAAPPAA